MAPQIGQDFGGYRVDAVIGRGGMGVVYRAWQYRLQRPVALKVLPPEFAGDPTYRERFGREATALARLDSPHVIQIYDHGQIDGSLYLAMQLVDGPDLSTALSSGPLPPQRALAVVDQVASALGDAHAVGVIHRDVKTGNVLLRRRTEHRDEDFAYLCDFGIARSADTAAHQETGGIVGTIGYLAPERLRGGPATVATDVYALGCLLWATLTGTQPFRGSQPEVIMAHVEAPVPQLHADDQRTAAVNDLLAAMMAKDPAARPSVPEVRERIRDVGTGPRVRTAPAPAPARPRTGRRGVLAAAAAVVVIAAAGAVVATRAGGPSGSPAERLARSTPAGIGCQAVAPSDDGVLAQQVCRPGDGVGELRVAALGSADAAFDYVRTGAGVDPDGLAAGRCPNDLPARQTWQRGEHGGTLVCAVLGTTTRYVWTDDDQATVSVLDGRAGTPFPADLQAVDDVFTAARFG